MAKFDTSELRKFVTPEIVFGEEALNLLPAYVNNYCARRVFLVTDANLRARTPWVDRVTRMLIEAGVPHVIFDEVSPNPRDHEVMAGAEAYLREKCDIIVALGGGSPMDCAKAIGVVATNERDVMDFEGTDEVMVPGPPLLCIPTTAGSSADVSQFAIITDTKRRLKFAIISKTMIPDVALIAPQTTMTLPPELTAATGMDALAHAVEAYVSNASSAMTDLNALKAIRLISKHLSTAVENPLDPHARGKMMLASLFAGLAFSNASLGLVHGMAHPLAGWLGSDPAHGDCCAILLEHVVRFNFEAIADRYSRIAVVMGFQEEDAHTDRDLLADALTQFRRRVGVHQTLSDMGLSIVDIPEIARRATCDPCVVTNPRDATQRQIEELYEQAL